jgi:cystathionine beta-lyase
MGVNPFGVLACETAYREGEPWLEQVMAYIEDNLDYLQDFIDKYDSSYPGYPALRAPTWCGWTVGDLGLDKWALKRLMLGKARIFTDEGFIFGPEGDGFERINIACPTVDSARRPGAYPAGGRRVVECLVRWFLCGHCPAASAL